MWYAPITCDDTCCEEPCTPPVVTCSKTETYYGGTFDYTITGADYAWVIETCGDVITNHPITLSGGSASGSFTTTHGCTYCVRARKDDCESECCDTVDETGCRPCGDTLGTFLYGVITISGIPDTLTSACSSGRGFSGASWAGFSGWNGTFVWTNVATPFVSLGYGTRTTPTGGGGTTTQTIEYGLQFQCGRADLVYRSIPLGLGITPVGSGYVGAVWTKAQPYQSGTCADSLTPSAKNVFVPNPSNGTTLVHDTCPINLGLAPPLELPAFYGSYEYWLVSEFS